MYINKETGEILTLSQARREFSQEYDGYDPTNCIKFSDIYEKISD